MESDDAIKVYKDRLSNLIDMRPSGTRQRLADALGKHRSFVTQMLSASYATPVPARHLPTIFSVCHFNAQERQSFLEAYRRAHPEKATDIPAGKSTRSINLLVHDLGDKRKNEKFDEALAEFARKMSALCGDDE